MNDNNTTQQIDFETARTTHLPCPNGNEWCSGYRPLLHETVEDHECFGDIIELYKFGEFTLSVQRVLNNGAQAFDVFLDSNEHVTAPSRSRDDMNRLVEGLSEASFMLKQFVRRNEPAGATEDQAAADYPAGPVTAAELRRYAQRYLQQAAEIEAAQARP